MRKLLVGLGIAAVIAAAGAAYLLTLGRGDLVVQDARIVATPDAPRDAKLFATIANGAGEADRLIGVATDLAWGCGFHGPTAAGGATPYIDVPAESIVKLGPGGAYIDLSNIGEPVSAGDSAVLTLVFERAGEIPVKAYVATPIAADAHGSVLHEPAPAGEPVPILALDATPMADGRVALDLTLENFTFDRGAVDGPHAPGRGHAHLYIDGVKIGRIYGPRYETEPLAPGRHEIEVVLNTNDHRAYAVEGVPIAGTAGVVVE